MNKEVIKEIVKEMFEWDFEVEDKNNLYEEVKEFLGGNMGYDLKEFSSKDILSICEELKK